MEISDLKKIVEAALLANGQPLTLDHLCALFDEAEAPGRDELKAALNSLMEDFEGHGIELREVASGFRFQVRQEMGPWVSRLWEERPVRYSRALLETLALIAYRQPITRSEIEEIRGVSVSSHIIKTLMEREWIRVAGHRDVPGRPALFSTTRQFLDSFNLKTLGDLPPLSEIRDLETINAELEFAEAESQGAMSAEELAAAIATVHAEVLAEAGIAVDEDEPNDAFES